MKIKDIAITGMGIALFVVLSMCLRVPIFQNYYICLGYVVMAVYLFSFGIVKGTIVGVFGTILYCLLINGLRGMPGWALGNIALGIIVGLSMKLAKHGYRKNDHLGLVYMLCIFPGIVLGPFIGIGIVKSFVEVLLYSQPFEVRLANNSAAIIADFITMLISMPICQIIDQQVKKYTER